MAFGPMPADRTQIGGQTGNFNTTDNQPVTRNSPWKAHFPGWRTVILGGSGGIYLKGHKRV